MERGEASIPDWRDGAAYAPLLAADRTVLAWEWLRRDPEYRTAAAASLRDASEGAARKWGLHRVEDPRLAAPCARPIWTSSVLDAVLPVRGDALDGSGVPVLASIPGFCTRVQDEGAERILLSDGWRTVRMDLLGPDPRAGPGELVFLMSGPLGMASRLLALRRFEALARAGRFARTLYPPEPHARRGLLVLRTADALADGAVQRDIAATLLDPAAKRPKWREERPELRLQAQRLVRDARAMLAGGYRLLLRTRSGDQAG